MYGTMLWPAIGPDVTGGQDPAGHAYKIPARVCYDNTSKDSNGILIFNANICYNDPVAPDTTPPTVSMTAPANGATVSSSAVTVSANASDNVGVVGVQFKLDGVNLGAEDTSNPYSISWNSSLAANGTHTLTALARDAAGNTATSAISVTVDNTPPLISTVSASNISSSRALITWATTEAGDSQVDYVPPTAHGRSPPFTASLLTAHAMTLTGLLATTPYHYRVKSRDAAGNLATSGDFTLTTLVVSAPTITSFTPTSGPVGTSVTISGTNFTGATAVTFNGVSAAPFTVTSATAIQATVPTGATTGPVSVTTAGGTATSASPFTVTASPPTITSFTPTSGPVGTSVTIS